MDRQAAGTQIRLIAGLLAVFALLVASRPLQAAELQGRIVRVIDGDTLSLLDASRVEHRLRLTSIDAPEKAQAFGARAKQALSDICFRKEANATVTDHDRYGREVARVSCEGTDAGEAMVRMGMAWVFRRYAPSSSPLYTVENEAHEARRGLWSDPSPVPRGGTRRQVLRRSDPVSAGDRAVMTVVSSWAPAVRPGSASRQSGSSGPTANPPASTSCPLQRP